MASQTGRKATRRRKRYTASDKEESRSEYIAHHLWVRYFELQEEGTLQRPPLRPRDNVPAFKYTIYIESGDSERQGQRAAIRWGAGGTGSERAAEIATPGRAERRGLEWARKHVVEDKLNNIVDAGRPLGRLTEEEREAARIEALYALLPKEAPRRCRVRLAVQRKPGPKPQRPATIPLQQNGRRVDRVTLLARETKRTWTRKSYNRLVKRAVKKTVARAREIKHPPFFNDDREDDGTE